ncbi:alpha/beta fold hydrolase [Kribbella qitaiheensis]|uniref:Alpha/beta fold hydrolase n=1 Tax=Kribbella qitaiheensis TaxID=1544730 RepID=A0A7G6WZJ5_9ACTN|nr:alpha/beta fold hydrolase [Kribbella qitaiheensis]QNE19410.1 alpha/beta fold hydrolase [Kribbella qitaiheensis]
MDDGELVDVGDVTLFVRELGERSERPSLVVIHGGPDVGHGYLLPGFEPLARDHHIVLFDFRGCGRSTRGLPDDALQPEYVVEDAHRLIDKLGLGEVDLLGFSTGGRAAMQFLEKHPDQVRRLVLASTTAYTDFEPQLASWDEYQRRRQAGESVSVWDLELAPAYDVLRAGLGTDKGDWSYERAISGAMHPWAPADPERVLRDAGKPILILHGEQDMGFPVEVAHRLHSAVPGSELAIIPSAGHMCHFEKAELWSGQIRRFLDAPLANRSGDWHPGAMETVYEAAGGSEGMVRLAEAWHSRVMADEVVSHAFSHGFHPQHSERLAAYWAEALGGPTTYSSDFGDESTVVRTHSGNGPHHEMDRRAIACFDQALDDVGLTDPLRQVLHDYFAWATTTSMTQYTGTKSDVPDGLSIPRWSWEGLVPAAS